MSKINLTPAELLELHDPTPEAPDPILIPREAWRQLIQRGFAETEDHVWIWYADGVQRLSKVWIGHPDMWQKWQDVILFRQEVGKDG